MAAWSEDLSPDESRRALDEIYRSDGSKLRFVKVGTSRDLSFNTLAMVFDDQEWIAVPSYRRHGRRVLDELREYVKRLERTVEALVKEDD